MGTIPPPPVPDPRRSLDRFVRFTNGEKRWSREWRAVFTAKFDDLQSFDDRNLSSERPWFFDGARSWQFDVEPIERPEPLAPTLPPRLPLPSERAAARQCLTAVVVMLVSYLSWCAWTVFRIGPLVFERVEGLAGLFVFAPGILWIFALIVAAIATLLRAIWLYARWTHWAITAPAAEKPAPVDTEL